MACTNIPIHKCGVCFNCHSCVFCPPPNDCLNHSRVPLEPPEPRSRRRRSVKRRRVGQYRDDEREDDEPPQIPEDEVANVSNKERLMSIFGTLNLTCDIDAFRQLPRYGFKAETIEQNERALRRAKSIVKMIHGGVCALICPSNADFFQLVDSVEKESARMLSKVNDNITKLVYRGHRSTRIIAESILARSYVHETIRKLLEERYETLGEDLPHQELVRKRTFGSEKFTSLQKTFDLLAKGSLIPRNNYTFRVDAVKLCGVVQFLMETLNVKPGVTRDVMLHGEKFHNMSVYERGGMSIEQLFTMYARANSDDEQVKPTHVGFNTFNDITKLSTKKGESKAGLSSYYINLRYMTITFDHMMNRIKELATEREEQDLAKEADDLKMEWGETQWFLLWKYPNKHLCIDDLDTAHCCRHALGGSCEHYHSDQSCVRCVSSANFFSMKLSLILWKVSSLQLNEED